jgi:hypothetical protein
MATDGAAKPQKTKAQAREERLKAALKANMARRKAQGRARSASEHNNNGPEQADEESS